MRFAGYAAIFDRVDRGGDVVRRGAFRNARIGVPLLWQHSPNEPIGVIERIGEDAHGLRVIGRLTSETQRGREAAALLKQGALSGLSFGYRVVNGKRRGQGRELSALDLVEISLVTFPMQPLARVHGVG
ncbi:HK97 family phage prohead protease [Sphingomonas cavernae]|uniref:HK97 family phage prohead protease n=1 Tax=Sphingomonas cavernae TaxID=2320861 RepID=UPI001EE5A844|nr:HK97 family phage prohead protease [Sphingomonas cavernae]